MVTFREASELKFEFKVLVIQMKAYLRFRQ